MKLGELTNILDGFEQATIIRDTTQKKLIEDSLSGFREARRHRQMAMATSADDFNFLRVINRHHHELTFSSILAWILNPEGTHAQGKLGFRLFLEELGFPVEAFIKEWFSVTTELAGEESRIDVEILSPGKFLIHVEVKVYASEGKNQLEREMGDLRKRAALHKIPEGHFHAFYLTANGGLPSKNAGFQALGWLTIQKLSARFSQEAAAPRIKWFAEEYSRAISEIVMENVSSEDANDQTD